MPADYGGWFEDAKNTIHLVGGEVASPFLRCSQHGQHPFLLAAGPKGMTLLAGEHVELLTEHQGLEVFVIAGKVSNAQKVDEDGEESCEQGEEHAGIVVSGLAYGKLESAKGGSSARFLALTGSDEVFAGRGRLTWCFRAMKNRCRTLLMAELRLPIWR
ncbi:MAG: hypothetical protein J5I90_08160 [Caldilineales bacterium]|nr:hypothetical protein [Caldilineales bacterium]